MKYSRLLLVIAFAGCGDAPVPAQPLDETPPTPAGAAGKSDVYGEDSRRELYDVGVSPAQRAAAQATAVLVGPGGVTNVGATVELSGRTLGQKITASEGGAACDSEPFIAQPAPGFCSGFLIAPDLVATAGHCVNIKTPFFAASYVFGFAYESADDAGVLQVPAADVYQARAVVGHVFDRGEQSLAAVANREYWQDWAVVQLDRPVVGRTPLPLRTAPLDAGDSVTSIGHPMGVPTKVAGGEVYDASKQHYVNTDLDIYQGNSGSVVVDAHGDAAGIVIRGTGGDSFVQTADGCFASRECAGVDLSGGSQCTGNHVMRSDVLRDFADPSVPRLIFNQLADAAPIPDGDPGGVALAQVIDEDGTIAYVTVNANLFHAAPADLEILLEHDGQTVAVARAPKVWGGGEVRFSRTTRGFDGASARGTWTLRVRDGLANGGNYQSVDWWQLVVGVRR